MSDPLAPARYLITGGSGFLATQLALILLERDTSARLRSTFRSREKADDWLAKFSQYRDKVEAVVVADLAQGGAPLVAAVQGCEIIFHAASPFTFTFEASQLESSLEVIVE